ncbi:MAG: FGGY family carbohydrate kinase [Pseudomonadota bacterium]
MESGVFVGIDHGGTTTTALIFEPGVGKRSSHSVAMPKQTPQPGLVEHRPEDFLKSSIEAAHGALEASGLTWRDVQAVGIANQGETSMAWSRQNGHSYVPAFGPALSWEDRRTADLCDKLASEGVDELIRQRTGIMMDPYFSASKFHWLLENVPEVRQAANQGELRLGGTDSYVIDRLTGGAVHATDAATASRTALFNLRRVVWDSDLLDAFGLKEVFLPMIRPTAGDFGTISHPDISAKGIPITADAVDAHAALFAQGCWGPQSIKATYGTGAFIEAATGLRPVEPDGKLPVFIAWQLGERVDYTVEGGVFAVGSAIDWCVNAGLIPSAEASAALASSVADTGGVNFVPSFTGLAAPHWESNTRASIFGLGLDSQSGHIARALLDGIAFQCAEIIKAIDLRLDESLQEVRADGGPSKNKYLMQRQADLLGLPVSVSLEPDMTALGAAQLAAIGAGQLTRQDVANAPTDTDLFEPKLSENQRQSDWADWAKAVEMAIEGSKK